MILAGKYSVSLELYIAVYIPALALYAPVCCASVMSAVLMVTVPSATTVSIDT